MNNPMKELAELPKERRDLLIKLAAKKVAEAIMKKRLEVVNKQDDLFPK